MQPPQADDNSAEDTQPTSAENPHDAPAAADVPVFSGTKKQVNKQTREWKRSHDSQAGVSNYGGAPQELTRKQRGKDKSDRENWTPQQHEQLRVNQEALAAREEINKVTSERAAAAKVKRVEEIAEEEAKKEAEKAKRRAEQAKREADNREKARLREAAPSGPRSMQQQPPPAGNNQQHGARGPSEGAEDPRRATFPVQGATGPRDPNYGRPGARPYHGFIQPAYSPNPGTAGPPADAPTGPANNQQSRGGGGRGGGGRGGGGRGRGRCGGPGGWYRDNAAG